MKYYFLLIFVILSCEKKVQSTGLESESNQKLNSPGIKVTTQSVKDTVFQKQLISNGVVEARKRSELSFKTIEQVTKIYVENGETVQEGKVLAELDNTLLKSRLEDAKIAFIDAERRLMAEKINFGLKGLPDEEIDPSVLKTIHQNSGYKSAQNALITAGILHDQTILKAPFSGKVANLSIKVGNFVSPSEVFCVLLSHQKLDVVFHVLEGDLSSIAMGQTVNITPFYLKNNTYKGEVVEINPVINDEGLVRIKARIINPSTAVIDGMNVRVEVNRPIEDVVVIPKEALVMRSNREVVFTVKNGLAQWNYVEITAENVGSYALSEGLNPGDTVIISGNLNLTQDARVIPTLTIPREEL